MKRSAKTVKIDQNNPLLDKVKVNFNNPIVDWNQYPFSLDLVKNLNEIEFRTQLTFIVGENVYGKLTILEAIANKAGFVTEGESKSIHYKTSE